MNFISKIVIAVVLMGSILSCSSKTESFSDDFVLEINPDIITYSEFVQHIEKIRIVPLETRPEAMIGNIYTIDIFEDRIYAFDFQFTKSVYIYNHKGEWINAICSLGKGPSEYTRISDVTFDPFNEELIILGDSKKILKYDKEGNFKTESQMDFYTLNIGVVNSTTYSIKSLDEQRRPIVITYDKKDKSSSTVYTGEHEFNKGAGSNFPRFKGRQLYLDYMNDTVYQISNGKAEPWRYIDFMNLKVTDADKEALKIAFNTKRQFTNVPKNKAGDIRNYHEVDEFIQLVCKYLGKATCVFIDKKSRDQYMLQRNPDERSPFDELLFPSGKIEESGEYVSVLHTDKYLDLLENDLFKSLQEKGIVEFETEGFENQTDVTLESNQVIALIKMK